MPWVARGIMSLKVMLKLRENVTFLTTTPVEGKQCDTMDAILYL